MVLSLALPFAVWPLVHFTSLKSVMGDHVAPRWMSATGFILFVLLCGLNGFLVYQWILFG